MSQFINRQMIVIILNSSLVSLISCEKEQTPPFVLPTSYYVSPSGNNANTGNQDNPFKTISYGESRLKGGDTLYIRKGTYNELVRIDGVIGGTSELPTVISAFNGEEVIIDGKGLEVDSGSALVMSSNNYTQFIGLTVINSIQIGILVNNDANYCKISNCIVHDVTGTGISIYGDNGIVEYCTVYNASLSNSDGTYSAGEFWSNAIDVRGSNGNSTIKHVIVRHNIVHDVWGEGISTVFADHSIVEDNIIYDIYNPLLYSRNSHNGLFQRNLLYMTKTMGDGSSVGIGHWNEGSHTFINEDNTIVNNIVYGCKRNLYHYNVTKGLIIANNTFVNSTYFACIQISDGASITNCIFKNNIVIQEDSLPPIWVEKGTGLVFSNNLYNKTYDTDAFGNHDLIGDPKIAKIGEISAGNLTSHYFRLLSTSPAINKGVTISNVSIDIFGNPRDTNPDIGACEYYPYFSEKK